MIQNTVDYYYVLLLKDFYIDENELKKIEIIVYPNDFEFRRVLNYKNNYIPMGAYYAGMLNIISPSFLFMDKQEFIVKEKYVEQGPIIHEMSHYFVDIKTKGEFEVWFSEGVALFYEYKYTNFEWRKDLKHSSKNIELKDLEKNFSKINENLAYRKSFDIVNDIVRFRGEEMLQKLISSSNLIYKK